MVNRFKDTIVVQVFGHHHTDSWKVYRDLESHEPTSFAFLAPSVTPWKSTLAPETGANNPGIRLFKYDIETGIILDYDQFWLNLTKANMEGSATWEFEYSFNSYYNQANPPSAQSLSDLLEEVRTDDKVFADYYFANTVRYEEATEETCDPTCHLFHYCAMSELEYAAFEECVAPTEVTTSQPSGTIKMDSIQTIIALLAFIVSKVA